MVTEFGMSKLGRLYLRDQEGPRFLGGFGDGPREHSEETAREVDVEVRAIIDSATDDVRSLLASRQHGLNVLAGKLVELEVIEGEELKRILDIADVERNGAAQNHGQTVD